MAFDRIRRFLGRHESPEPGPPPSPAVTGQPDERPEWMKRIEAINARCEERRQEMLQAQGGRIASEEPRRVTDQAGRAVLEDPLASERIS